MVFSLGCYTARAQPAFHLSGKVTDSTGIALSSATVSIITQKDTVSTLTTEEGHFAINNLTQRKFRLWVTMKGYFSFNQSFSIGTENPTVQLAPIILRANYNELDPVTVTRVRPITIGGDTVTYHAAAFPVRDGSEVEDILKRLPGVEVAINGDVIIQGKKVGKVLVNGKEFFGGDVLLAIRNLPADVVDKLQIIDDYGDKARLTGIKSGESAKMLNIVMKQDKRNGQFGQLNAGLGDYGKYAGNVFSNAFKGERQVSATGEVSNNSPIGSNFSHNTALSYADLWNLHWSGSINLNNSSQNPHSSTSTIQDNFYPGQQLHQTQSSQNSAHNTNNTLNTTLTYKPNSYSTLRLDAAAILQDASNQATNDFTSLQQDSGFSKSTTGSSLNTTQTTGQSASSTIYYEKTSPHSKRRFSAQTAFDYTNNRQSSDNQTHSTILTDSASSSSLLYYLVTSNNNNWNVNVNTNYFMPISPSSFLEFGYRGQSARSHSNLRTQIPGAVNNHPVTVDSLSQDLSYYTITQNIHAGYSGHLHQWDLSANLNAQPGLLQGTTGKKGTLTSYHYFSLAPEIQGSWIIDKVRKINLSYNGHPSPPSLQQLTPYTNVTNPQYPVTGNPALKPTFVNQASIRYEQSALQSTQFQGFGVGLSYTTTQHTIIENTVHPKDSSAVIQRTTYLNAGTTNIISADYHLNFPALFNKQFRITTNGSLNNNQTPTMTDGLMYNNQTWIWTQDLHFQLLIPDLIETDLEGNYSVTHANYPGSGNLLNTFKTATFTLNTKQYLFRHWVINCQFYEAYTTSGKGLRPSPPSLTYSIQRQFLPHNKATISITGYNLLNTSTGIGQSTSPTGITQSKTQFIGRYFFCTFLLKLNRFQK
ncbi:MAG TPA: TonB-dependent receptor [Puia sp.]|nr:TonB-dependent receptor [Puia sp.]